MLHGDWLARRASYTPHRLALVDVDRADQLSWRALHRQAHGAAADLRTRGIGVGDRVAVLASNRLETIVLFFACARIGAILVPLNWRLALPELAAVVADAEPAVLFAEQEFAAVAAALRVPTAPLQAWSGLDGDTPVALAADTPAMLLYTSGSTGRGRSTTRVWSCSRCRKAAGHCSGADAPRSSRMVRARNDAIDRSSCQVSRSRRSRVTFRSAGCSDSLRRMTTSGSGSVPKPA